MIAFFISLHIDKMSRLFIDRNESIHTFQFPFSLSEEDSSGMLKIFYEEIELESKVTSILLSIFGGDNQCFTSIEAMIDEFCDIMDDFSISSDQERNAYWRIFQFLLLFEPGYLRYDYDPANCNGNRHPLNHVDLYYTGNNTFKLGLHNRINSSQLMDILDINTECLFLA